MNKSNIEVVLGLGSNLGDRLRHLEMAIIKLEELNIINNVIRSNIYQTKALLKKDSPKEWDIDFLNMAVRGITQLSPLQLLEAIKIIEQAIGRKASAEWAPREIDIDILIYGEESINQENLVIPHAGLLERSWCIIPLAKIYPEWKYPLAGPYYQLSAQEIVDKLKIANLTIYPSR